MAFKSPDHVAHERFQKDIIGGLRRMRLAKMMHPPTAPAPKEPEDLGGYDKLQEMYDEKKK